MPTLFPRGVTPEMLKEANEQYKREGHRDNCENNSPSLACMAHSLLDDAHEIIKQGTNPRNGLLMMLVMALSTGIEVARAAPGWSIAAQEELEEWFFREGANMMPPTSHEVHREIIQHFAERHPLEVTNEDQDIIREKATNERQPLEV